MDAEKAAAACPTRGSRRLDGGGGGRGRREKGGVAVGERRRGGQRQAHKGRVDPPRRAARGAGLRCPREVDPAGLRRSDLRVCRRGGRFPVPLTQPPARGAAKERSLGSRGLRAEAAAAQRPNASRAALATVGMSTRRGRELASITASSVLVVFESFHTISEPHLLE